MAVGSPLIAVVDNEPSVRKAIGRLLASHGYEVALFASGEDFLRQITARPIDCVILDLHMPQIDGFEVLETLATMDQPVPAVIVITGHDSPESKQRVDSIGGAHAYLRKPVDEMTIINAITSAIAAHLSGNAGC